MMPAASRGLGVRTDCLRLSGHASGRPVSGRWRFPGGYRACMEKSSADLVFGMLTLICWAFLVVVGIVALSALFSQAGKSALSRLQDMLEGQTIPLAWVIALVAMVGSLMYSEAFHLVPCRYCWFQRIGIYPLAIILGIAVFTRDRGVKKYVLGLNIPTILVSTWHVLIERFPDLEPESLSCDPLNPCTQIVVNQFRIITLPTMALTTSVTIATLMLLTRRHVSADLGEQDESEETEDGEPVEEPYETVDRQSSAV